ncbi:amidohydrolase family protein [Nonomuraea sp. NPDC047529]|uniref:amidohydrolase n=1 Tax=Nonomuraea sp. NPDC047529 TaxID=3155623 RepID=UPI003409F5F4
MNADIVFTRGTIRTGAAGVPVSDALAVTGDRISALGEAALSARGPGTEVVDLAGGALLPAFGDGHVHPLAGGMSLRNVQVRDCTGVEEVCKAVRTWAAEHPEAEWITGEGVDPWLAPGGCFDARWLDAAVPDRPVLLRTMDLHTAWVNSEALRRAGYTAATPDPTGGQIVRRDGSSEPLGTLREFGAMNPILALLPEPGLDLRLTALREATTRLAAAGVTWVQDALAGPEEAETWIAAAEDLPVRAGLAFLMEPEHWREQIGRFPGDQDRVESAAPGTLTGNAVKFFADGVIEAGTAALLRPYTDCPHSHGIANWSPRELADAGLAGWSMRPSGWR